ncbi:hypothetical protein DFH11DRAFT_1070300 [Phellopilus nigrolimitatus]|nr:hypothetical protein DFH11DRAFT_1070300 [Phellopilus nigrolimitatus]
MSSIVEGSNLPFGDLLKLLNQVVQDQQTCRYLAVISLSAMLYDIMITIEQEYSLVWRAKWTRGKFLFFLIRYPAVIEGILYVIYSVDLHASDTVCKIEANYFSTWGTLVFLIPLQIVVILRIIALWERNRVIVALLVLTALATDVTILATMIRVMQKFHFKSEPLLRPILGCTSGLTRFSPTVTIPVWSAVIAFDTVIFGLTLARALRTSLSISNFILLAGLPSLREGLIGALTPTLRASFSIVGSRIALNLRGALVPYTVGPGANRGGDGPKKIMASVSSSDSSEMQMSHFTRLGLETLELGEEHTRPM